MNFFKSIRITVGGKIFGIIFLLIVLFSINALVIVNTSNRINEMVKESSGNIRPSSEVLHEFVFIVSKSKMLITNWVNLPYNVSDKKELLMLHNITFPNTRERLLTLAADWKTDSLRNSMQQTIEEFDELLALQRNKVINVLVTFNDYEDPLTKFSVDDALESEIIPRADQLITRLGEITKAHGQITYDSDKEMADAMSKLSNITIALAIILVLIALIAGYAVVNNITNSIVRIKDVVRQLGLGKINNQFRIKDSNDELGEMGKAVQSLITGLKGTAGFADKIGKGEYNAEFVPLSKEDVLGNALISMRDNLASVASEDKKRNWATEGMAKFSDVLRNNQNLKALSENVIRELVKYLGVNQGGFYVVEEVDRGEEPYMTMSAAYAWGKQKLLEQKIYRGDGLSGQAWQEGMTIYLTDVPDNYITITSGLGDANPSVVLLVPLKVNDIVYGVIEIASFHAIEEYKKEWLERIAESIASSIATVRMNTKTKKLLEESQEMTEQMRSQEEEMRQNMEELQATQEEIDRNQRESENTIEAINNAIQSLELDVEGTIIKANDNFCETLGYSSNEIIDEPYRMFVSKEEKFSEDFRNFLKDLANGVEREGEFLLIKKTGDECWLKGSFTPFKDAYGNVLKVLFFGVNISSYKIRTARQELVSR
ncbi:MAG: PAS domain-containing protein [Cyclobacteriaceae bacterium]|nr:PAS domain-containing protein [Cyclobacteriaceae bacterium]